MCDPGASDAIDFARDKSPDLIIMDIQLLRRSGLEITKDLKANDDLKHISIVAVTAFAMKCDKSKILEAGCDGYIAKPINVPVFFETVAKYLS